MEFEQFVVGWGSSSMSLCTLELFVIVDLVLFGSHHGQYVRYPCYVLAIVASLIFFFGHLKATMATAMMLRGHEGFSIVRDHIVERRTIREILNPLNNLTVRGFIWRFHLEWPYLKQVFGFNFFRP